jgi:hypothetical protein
VKTSEAISALPLLPEALLALLVARNRLAAVPAGQIIKELQAPSNGGPGSAQTVSRAVRIGARIVPFRSDCLVQAMAARSMLDRRSISSEFYIGVARRRGEDFSAHAWLKSGGEIVVGGNVSGFTPLIEPD